LNGVPQSPSLILLASIALILTAPAAAADEASSATRYPNCKALNAKYAHGVGKVGARDKTTGTPVTTFKRSNSLYRINAGRDRDKDGIACEKR
jgi:Excalibur calcium-binding domain